jgi:hypothetical protein
VNKYTRGFCAPERREDVRTSECRLLTTVLQYPYFLTDDFDVQHRKRYSRRRAEDVRDLCWQMDVNVRMEWTVNVGAIGSHEHSTVQSVDALVRGTP